MIRCFAVILSSPIVAMVFLTSSIAHAEVFKCVDESTGKVTFTDTACPDKGTGDYVPVKPANADSGYPTATERTQRQSQRTKSKAQSKSSKTSQSNAVAGYECSGGGKTWVSRTPCPATTKNAVPVSVDGITTGGDFVTGTGTAWQDVPVTQQSLKKKDYCKKSKMQNSDSAYERNKAGCSYWDYQ